MILLAHGYGLAGAGSNLWTHAVVQALCRLGETVHVATQDGRPERYPFVSALYTYDADGTATLEWERDVETPGRCIAHRPHVDLLPTYVRPLKTSTSLRSILDMDAAALDAYVGYNAAALETILREHDITAVHVNHVVLLAAAVRRACLAAGVPYAVMPHGSAIEYIVKQSESMKAVAAEALADAAEVWCLNGEIERRLREVFPHDAALEAKLRTVPVGVDIDLFGLIPRTERDAAIHRLERVVASKSGGRRADATARLTDGLGDDADRAALLERLDAVRGTYEQRAPDADLVERLERVDWQADEFVVFVGRMLGYKGIPALVAAFPLVLAERPRAHLVLAGGGPARDVMEMLRWALANGHWQLARNIARWGGTLEGESDDPFPSLDAFFDDVERRGERDAYLEAARALTPERVLFTGYLEHDALCLVQACCDVGVFPSVVKEASPLVIPESLASGCFPMGAYHAGMAASIDLAADAFPEAVHGLMRLRPEPEHLVRDIAARVPEALALDGAYREEGYRFAREHMDWKAIAHTVLERASAMRRGSA